MQAALVPYPNVLASVSGTSLVFLAVLGFISARAGGSNVLTGAWRFAFWGALAMAITAGAGALFGAVKWRSDELVTINARRRKCIDFDQVSLTRSGNDAECSWRKT